jgi:hypothetical protein
VTLPESLVLKQRAETIAAHTASLFTASTAVYSIRAAKKARKTTAMNAA